VDFENYFKKYNQSIYNLLNAVNSNDIKESVTLINNCLDIKGKIFITGNGGSASIASHVSVDFVKVAKIPSLTFNNANLITCFANDYSYENWITESIKAYSTDQDLQILISSSGQSKNIINAANYCKNNNINLITLSGFDQDNPLSKLGNVNFHINSDNYNYIEMSHNIILLSIVDIFANKLLN